MRRKRILMYLAIATAGLFSLAILIKTLNKPVMPADSALKAEPATRSFGDSMDRRSRSLIGLRGIDCGRVKINGDPKMATDCALKAEREGTPFRVRYDLQGIDSAVADGIVRTPSGELYALDFDSLSGPPVEHPCSKPYDLWVDSKGQVNCYQQ